MPLTMYDASVPVFAQILEALAGVLEKAEAHATARKIDPAVLIAARLAPDMFPLSRQVQIACDFAKGATARLAGVEVPSWGDGERTFGELKERERLVIAAALERAGGKVSGPGGAAEILDVPPTTLDSRLRALGLRGKQHSRPA